MSLTLETVPLADTVGVEIRGVDAAMLVDDPELPEAVLETLEANGVIVFRELHLDDETQVAFSKRLGRVEVFPGEGKLPEISIVSAHAVTSSGGETEFASTYAAHDALTDEEKERFADIDAPVEGR